MKNLLMTVALLLAVASAALAQTVKNPTRVEFTSPDHANAQVTGYEFDIITTAGAVSQTIVITKSQCTVGTDGVTISATINVQPINFGNYTSKMRTVAGTLKSEDSPASNAWERSPGAPSKPVPR